MRKRKIQARGEQNVVLLGTRRRIGYINVAKRILPSQPLADLGHGAKVECPSILASVIQVREKVELLSQQRVHPQLVAQFLAHGYGSKASAGQGRVFFTGIVKAAEQVQCSAVILDHVHAQTAAEYGTKVLGRALEFVDDSSNFQPSIPPGFN